MQRAVEAGDGARVDGVGQRLDQVGLEAQHEGQGFEFLQHRLKVGRHQLQLALALGHQLGAGALRAEQAGGRDQAARQQQAQQYHE